MPKYFPRNPRLASVLIVLLILFIDNPSSSRDLIIFMTLFIYSLETINFVCFAESEGCVSDPNTFLWTAASVADAAAVNSNDIKTLLSKGLSTFPIKSNPVFFNSHKSLPKNPPDCPDLCN